MPLPSFRIGGAWKSSNGTPYGRIGGAWKSITAGFTMRWVLLTEDPITYSKTWHRMFDYTTPTQYVPGVSMGWDGDESSGGPYRVEVGWTPTYGYPVQVILYQWNGGSWSQMETGVVADSAGGWNSSYLFYDGDEVYVAVRYLAHEGVAAGPTTNTTAQVFTW